MSDDVKNCSECGGESFKSRSCGVFVCDDERCGNHEGLVRCYCGWAASGGDGVIELYEMGEYVDQEC